MTYPPQQPPEPGPYGPQPGWPGPQQGQPGPGPYGPPPGQGVPPSGPYGPPPGQFGQQPPGGFPPGPGGQSPGGGSKKGRWIGIGAAVLVVVAAVLVTGLAAPGWMLGSDNGLHDFAKNYVTALQRRDFDQQASVSCEGLPQGRKQELRAKAAKAPPEKLELLKTERTGDTEAYANVRVTITGGSYKGKSIKIHFNMGQQPDGSWCVHRSR